MPFAVCLLVFGGVEGVQAMVREIKETGTVSVSDSQIMPLAEKSAARVGGEATPGADAKVFAIALDGWALHFMKPETVAQSEKTPETREAALYMSRQLFESGQFLVRPSFVEESGGIRMGIVSAPVPIQGDAKIAQALHRVLSECASSSSS